jgi:serine/threonine protein kinase
MLRSLSRTEYHLSLSSVPYEPNTNPELVDLLQKMLTKDPEERITVNQIRVILQYLFNDTQYQKLTVLLLGTSLGHTGW